ncbi:espin-like protein [Mustelus asterias]
MVPHRCLLAVKDGDLETLKNLDANGTLNESIEDHLGASPVHHAARSGQLDCLKFLITQAKLPANKRAKNGATPTHDAAATGNLAALQWLNRVAGCDIHDCDDYGATVLHLAARFGRSDTVQWLLQEGCDPRMETDNGAVPAHYAAAKGDLTCLKLLINHTPRVLDKQTRNGATPLYLACQAGHIHIVEFMVKDCKANFNLRAHDGMTALHAAAQMGHCALVVWLKSFTDIDLSAQDNEGATAMHFAASGGHAETLDRLIRMGARIQKDHWGGTPLHDAAENGELECCQILVMNHVDPIVRDDDGYTAAELADYNGNVECAKYLRHIEKMPPLDDTLASVQRQESFRKTKSIVRQQSSGDYYRSINEGRRESRDFQKGMENGKSTSLVKPASAQISLQSQPPLPSPKPLVFPAAPELPKQNIQNSSSGKPFNMVHPIESNSAALIAELKSGKKLKSVDFGRVAQTSQNPVSKEELKENGLVSLPVDEVTTTDVDLLVPTHDEKGRPIPEWKRQVMVRKLQARLKDEEEQRKKQKEETALFSDLPLWKREMMIQKLNREKILEEKRKEIENQEMNEQSAILKQLGYDENQLLPWQRHAILINSNFLKSGNSQRQ